MECEHTTTQENKCIECGELVFAYEIHTCSECKNIKIISGGIPICKKKYMTVLLDMHVYYKIKEGTCFEQNNI